MLVRRSVFDDVFRLFDGLDLPSLPVRRADSFGGLYPAVESFTRDGKLMLRAELPGVGRDELDITVEDGRLTLRGEKKAETERNESDYHVREVRYGRFERSFVLPEGVKPEDVTAKLEGGVLEISLPLAEPAKRKIEVKVAGGKEKNKPKKVA